MRDGREKENKNSPLKQKNENRDVDTDMLGEGLMDRSC